MTLIQSRRISVAVSSGSPTLQESQLYGAVEFVDSDSESVVFDCDQPDALYVVSLDPSMYTVTAAVTVREAAGFTISTSAACVGVIKFIVSRSLL